MRYLKHVPALFPETHLQETGEVSIKELGHIRPVCVVRRGHPLLDLNRVTLADLATFTWASSVGSNYGPDVQCKSRMICDNYHILRDTALLSDLVCICSEAFFAEELRTGPLVEIAVDGLPLRPTAIYAAHLKGRLNSPLAERARI